jgi:hypothetical protein
LGRSSEAFSDLGKRSAIKHRDHSPDHDLMQKGVTGMSSSSKSWRDVLAVHPAADLLPMMNEPELLELGQGILKRGLLEGVVAAQSCNRLLPAAQSGRSMTGHQFVTGPPSRSLRGPTLSVAAIVYSMACSRKHTYHHAQNTRAVLR